MYTHIKIEREREKEGEERSITFSLESEARTQRRKVGCLLAVRPNTGLHEPPPHHASAHPPAHQQFLHEFGLGQESISRMLSESFHTSCRIVVQI